MKVEEDHEGTEESHSAENYLRRKEYFLGRVVPRYEAAWVVAKVVEEECIGAANRHEGHSG